MNLSKTTDKGGRLWPPENQLFYDWFFTLQSGNSDFRNIFSRPVPGPHPPCQHWKLPARRTTGAAM